MDAQCWYYPTSGSPKFFNSWNFKVPTLRVYSIQLFAKCFGREFLRDTVTCLFSHFNCHLRVGHGFSHRHRWVTEKSCDPMLNCLHWVLDVESNNSFCAAIASRGTIPKCFIPRRSNKNLLLLGFNACMNPSRQLIQSL